MEPSSELGAVVGRFFGAIDARDPDTFLNLHADEPGVLFIGTDPDEWWPSFQSFSPVLEAQIREFEAGAVTFDGWLRKRAATRSSCRHSSES